MVSDRVDELAGLFVGFAFALQYVSISQRNLHSTDPIDIIFITPGPCLSRPCAISFLPPTSLR